MWLEPLPIAEEQLPAGEGEVFLTYQLPEWSAMLSVAVVAVMALTLSEGVVNELAVVSRSALAQPVAL